jgi:hypothetical protein
MTPHDGNGATGHQATAGGHRAPVSRLILQPGTENSSTYELAASVLITRRSDHTLRIGTSSFGTPCARIRVENDGGCHLTDNGSAEPTLVNGRFVGDVRLTDGDVITFAGIECHFEEGWAHAGT